MALHPLDHLGGHRPLIERTRPLLGDQAHRFGKLGIGDALAERLGRPVRIVVEGPNGGLLAQRRNAGEPGGKPGRDRKPVARHGDRRRKQIGPGELAALLMGKLQHRQQAGHTHRDAGGDGLAEAERLALGIEEHRRAGARRRRLATVVDRDGLRAGIVMQQEAATADARGLRLDDTQDHLDGNRGIDGRTAAPQHVQSGLDRKRMGRRHHCLRCREACRSAARRQQQKQGGA